MRVDWSLQASSQDGQEAFANSTTFPMALAAQRSLWGYVVPPGAEHAQLHDFLRVVYRLLDNRVSLDDAMEAFDIAVGESADGDAGPVVDETAAPGLDYDGFSQALLHFARLRARDTQAPSARSVTDELCSAGVLLMPDLVVQSMLQRDVLGVLADFRAGLERLFAAYTADKVGVVMEWEEVVYAKMALSQERFITLAAATGIFPLLSKEDLSAIFAAVLDNSEGARERVSLGERLAFPHFQELLCCCAARMPAPATASGRRAEQLHGRQLQVTVKGGEDRGQLEGGASLAERLRMVLVKVGLQTGGGDRDDDGSADADAGAGEVDDDSSTDLVEAGDSAVVAGTGARAAAMLTGMLGSSRGTASASEGALVEFGHPQEQRLSRPNYWLIDKSDGQADRVATMLAQLQLPAARRRLRAPQPKGTTSVNLAKANAKDLLSNRPDEHGFRPMPATSSTATDLTGPKPSLLKEVIFPPEAPPEVAALLEAALAYHRGQRPDFKRAADTYHKAERVWAELLGDPPVMGKLFLWNAIGSVHESAGDDEVALSFFMDAKTLAAEKLPGHHPDNALSLANIGAVCYQWGHYGLALRCFDSVMHTRESVLGKQHVDTAVAWNNVGCCYDCLGESGKARLNFQRALNCMKPQLRLEHPRVSVAMRNLQRNKHKPIEMAIGQAPYSNAYRPDRERWIPGGRFYLPAARPAGGGGKKKKKGKKKGKKKK